MNRFLTVWLPNWPIHRLVVKQPELSGKPIVLSTRDSRQRQIVAACSSKAQSLGVRKEMPLADATAIAEGKEFVVQPHEITADQDALAALTDWCNQFSPLVAVDFPDSLYLDLDGVTHLYGDETALVNCVAKAFRARGYRPRLAIADTPSAAWAVAHYAKASLAIVPTEEVQTLFTLPVAALRLPDATLDKLDRLGIHRIKQLVGLPRKSLPSRIGAEVIDRLDYLTGGKIETICGFKPPPMFEQQWQLDQATAHRETIRHVVRVLLDRLAKQLYCHSHGANRLTICLDCTNNQPVKIRIGLYQASADARRFDELAQLQMETTRLLASVECVTVTADETEKLEQQQHSLLAAEHHVDPRELADLVERLSSRLSAECVVRAQAVDEWQPEQAFSYQPLTQGQESRDGVGSLFRKNNSQLENRLAEKDSRPLHMLFPPEPIEVVAKFPDGPPARFHYHGEQRLANCWGPERLEIAWWRGTSVRRDYYRVETESASRFWVFRRLNDGKWFLHGCFD